MLHGRFLKQRGGWSAECEAIGAFTQGVTRKEAAAMLAEVVELIVDHKRFRATVTQLARNGDEVPVVVAGSDPTLLAAAVLKYQRERGTRKHDAKRRIA
jgi:hypothetical protein